MVQLKLRTSTDIGAIIRDRRRALSLDQAELATRIGVKRLWVNQVERGKPGASLGLVLRALAAVDVEIWGAAVVKSHDNSDDTLPATTDINAIVAQAKRKSQP
jgi:HTH-type transcriptional regulator / antitoxin HipB